MIEETRSLLALWDDGMNTAELYQVALDSGQFPNMSARRLRNLVAECFAPRLLVADAAPAKLMKLLMPIQDSREFAQMLFVFTCRANLVLADFVREVYWDMYSAGRDSITISQARDFVQQANSDGKTVNKWSETTIQRVATYLMGCCADFGLLDTAKRGVRTILPFRIQQHVAATLAYELHFCGYGDNQIVQHPDWRLFGLERADVLSEFKRLSMQGFFIIQNAGTTVRISWQYATLQELINVLAKKIISTSCWSEFAMVATSRKQALNRSIT